MSGRCEVCGCNWVWPVCEPCEARLSPLEVVLALVDAATGGA